ncbi:MAG: four helix bundle protein [Patescibacteria group bacterium]
MEILHKTQTLYRLWHDWLKDFPKLSRYTLGIRVDNLFIELLENLFAASYLPRQEKSPLIKIIIKKIDLLKFLIWLSWELRLLSDNKYQNLSLPLEEIGRSAWNWGNRLEKTPPLWAEAQKQNG